MAKQVASAGASDEAADRDLAGGRTALWQHASAPYSNKGVVHFVSKDNNGGPHTLQSMAKVVGD